MCSEIQDSGTFWSANQSASDKYLHFTQSRLRSTTYDVSVLMLIHQEVQGQTRRGSRYQVLTPFHLLDLASAWVGCFLLSPEAATSAVSRPDQAAETALLSTASQYPHTSASSYSADSDLRRRRTKCIYVKRFLCEIVTRSRKYGWFRPGLTSYVFKYSTCRNAQFKRSRQKKGILDRREQKIKSDEIRQYLICTKL